MCPSIDDVISVNRLGMRDGPRLAALKVMASLIVDIRSRQFDLLIDFLSFRETNLLAFLSKAPQRLGMKRHGRAYLPFCFNLPPVKEDKSVHVSEMFQRIVDAVTPGCGPSPYAPPVLIVPEHARQWAAQFIPEGPLLSLYVDAPVDARRWPEKNFAAVADFAAGELGATVAVLAGPRDTCYATNVRQFSRKRDRLLVVDDVSIPQLSAVIARSRLLVSNDTGPMHLGPALGVPTLGLFSVGYPQHYRPLGEHSRFLRAQTIQNIRPEDVIRHVSEMWRGQ
jgi:ADP-heptose:LPS heptosyltransferase